MWKFSKILDRGRSNEKQEQEKERKYSCTLPVETKFIILQTNMRGDNNDQ